MINLPNNCKRGKISITPKNWETGGKELISKDWCIRYQFYDNNLKQIKDVRLSNFNRDKTLAGRRQDLKEFMVLDLQQLQEGYNPILKGYPEGKKPIRIEPTTPNMSFEAALRFADTKITVSESTREHETNHMLAQIIAEAKKQGIADTSICDISRKHLRELLEEIAITKTDKVFSNDKFNRGRKVLSYYYRQLLDFDVVDANIPEALNSQKLPLKKVEVEITAEMQEKVSTHLRNNYRPFWLYLQVFYNSAPRSTEMMRLKVGDVDFVNQRVKFTIEKGKQHTEKYRVIPDIAVKYWREIIGDSPISGYGLA